MRERYAENGYAGLFESSADGACANIPKQHDADAGIIEAFRQVVDCGDCLPSSEATMPRSVLDCFGRVYRSLPVSVSLTEQAA
jgi:hypothetical protein